MKKKRLTARDRSLSFATWHITSKLCSVQGSGCTRFPFLGSHCYRIWVFVHKLKSVLVPIHSPVLWSLIIYFKTTKTRRFASCSITDIRWILNSKYWFVKFTHTRWNVVWQKQFCYLLLVLRTRLCGGNCIFYLALVTAVLHSW